MAKTITLYGHSYEQVTAPKRIQRMQDAFNASYCSRLDEVYGSYSGAKARAIEYCYAREREFGSLNGVITSYCTCFFTYAFTGEDEFGRLWLIYITPNHDYACLLRDTLLQEGGEA